MERVLIIDDDPDFCRFAELAVRSCGFAAASTTNAEACLETLAREEFGVVLADVHLDGASGIDLCARIAERWENIPVVVMTARGTLETAIAAIRAGAYDFVTKPLDRAALERTLERAWRHQRLSHEIRRAERFVAEPGFEKIVGESDAMKRVLEIVARVAPLEAPILITGESGTGKELVARAIHEHSERSGPFVALSCAAVPENLLESELFGHARGAFTDARAARIGLLAQASGGTLFLDEIGDMSLALQPKLLRVLQERCFRPIGSNDEVAFDARIVAATNRDLESAVRDRAFREDLFFRLNVVRIHVPPLRARGGDVFLLAHHFARRSGSSIKISEAAAEKLARYPWPGNVRELSNCIEHAAALTRGSEIVSVDLPDSVREWHGVHDGDAPAPKELVPLEELEREYILKVLREVGGNKTVACKILGLDRKTLYRRLRRYEAG